MSKTELKTMRRSKIYYARMRATANKTGRKNDICLSRKMIRRLQKLVRRNEKYKKRVYTLLCNKIEKSETESLVSMQVTRFIDKALKKGYNQTLVLAE